MTWTDLRNHNFENLKELRCTKCNRLLKQYEGKFGKFLGCPNWISDEECRDTYTLEYTIRGKG